ncbi:hypothetical protein T484DRAFT_1877674 [Baffinella frigidus]|nr:hypothetical protein T484DRAFT_1877674 [Cryptophyta sp. CCMP2293]
MPGTEQEPHASASDTESEASQRRARLDCLGSSLRSLGNGQKLCTLSALSGIKAGTLDRTEFRLKRWNEFVLNMEILGSGIAFCVSLQSIMMALATVVATFMCSRAVLNISFKTSIDVVTYGTVLPLTLGLESAWNNCNSASTALAKLKAAAITLYMMMDVWDNEGEGKLGTKTNRLLEELVRYIHDYCSEKNDPRLPRGNFAPADPSAGAGAERWIGEVGAETAAHRIWDIFAELAILIEASSAELGTDESKGGQGAKGRCYECLRKMICEWEKIKVARTYLSPRNLRTFTALTIYLVPLFLAPYWNSFCADEKDSVSDVFFDPLYGCTSGYFVAILFTLVVAALYRVRESLDDPLETDGLREEYTSQHPLETDGLREEYTSNQQELRGWSTQLHRLATLGEDGPRIRRQMRKDSDSGINPTEGWMPVRMMRLSHASIPGM